MIFSPSYWYIFFRIVGGPGTYKRENMKFKEHLEEVKKYIIDNPPTIEQIKIVSESEGKARLLKDLSEEELSKLLRAHNTYED